MNVKEALKWFIDEYWPYVLGGKDKPCPEDMKNAFYAGYCQGFSESDNAKPRTYLLPQSMNVHGLDTGIMDRKGNTVHLGDTLEFDEIEWGGKRIEPIKFEDGELNFSAYEIPEWCTIVKKWDE